MRCLVAAVSSATTPDGVTRHAVNLACALLLRPEIERVDLVIGCWQESCLKELLPRSHPRLRLVVADAGPSSLSRNLWYSLGLSRLARDLSPDVVHLSYPAPIFRSRFACPVIVTLHDFYPYDCPENFGYPRVVLNRLILHRCLSAADAVSCVSEATLARVKEHRQELSSKAGTIPNCVEQVEPLSGEWSAAPVRQPFLLTIAQHRRNKNIPLTLAIFRNVILRHPEMRLLIVGREGPETQLIRRLTDEYGISHRVHLLSGISDEQLQACYRQCSVLLATSSVEGFGLPIAEAMVAGCPIVCSDIAAFRELSSYSSPLVPLGRLEEEAFTEAVEEVIARPRPDPVSLPQLSLRAIGAGTLQLYRNTIAASIIGLPSSVRLSDQQGVTK